MVHVYMLKQGVHARGNTNEGEGDRYSYHTGKKDKRGEEGTKREIIIVRRDQKRERREKG